MIKIKGSDLNDKFNPSAVLNRNVSMLQQDITAFLLERRNAKRKAQFHVYHKNTKQSSFLGSSSYMNNMSKEDVTVSALPRLFPDAAISIPVIQQQPMKQQPVKQEMNQSRSDSLIIHKFISKGCQTNKFGSIFPIIPGEAKKVPYVPIRRMYKSRVKDGVESIDRSSSPKTFIKNKLISRMLRQISIKKNMIYQIS